MLPRPVKLILLQLALRVAKAAAFVDPQFILAEAEWFYHLALGHSKILHSAPIHPEVGTVFNVRGLVMFCQKDTSRFQVLCTFWKTIEGGEGKQTEFRALIVTSSAQTAEVVIEEVKIMKEDINVFQSDSEHHGHH